MAGFGLRPESAFCIGRRRKLCDTVFRLRNISNISECVVLDNPALGESRFTKLFLGES